MAELLTTDMIRTCATSETWLSGGKPAFDRWLADHDRQVREQALRAAAELWRPYVKLPEYGDSGRGCCPTCEGPWRRETTNLMCQTCGHDYGAGR